MRVFLGMAAAAMAMGAGQAQAQDRNFAVGAGVGTAGFEAHAALRLNDMFSVRGSGNFFSYDIDETYDDIAYSGELDMNSFGAFVDVRPFQNALTLTGGAYFGGREIALSARPTTNVAVGNGVYTPAQIGRLDSTIELGDTAPYVGLGFDNTFTGEGRWGFRAAAGVAIGDPQVTVRSVGGTFSSSPQVQADLQREADNILNDLDGFEYYPVLSLGATYRF